MIPVLYSFRRCPYAMRARLALAVSEITVQHREVLLKNKPASMLQYSPKGTVPVLVLENSEVIDESLDIMLWALKINDPQSWLPEAGSQVFKNTFDLIHENDFKFKHWLDRYKYADRYPEQSLEYYREQGMAFIAKLDGMLQGQAFLLGDKCALVDMAILPFVRQFAHVDREWFYQAGSENVITWLDGFLGSGLFVGVMQKFAVWEDVD